MRIRQGQRYHLWILDSGGHAFKSLQIMGQDALLQTIKRYQRTCDCVNIEVIKEKDSGQNERILIWYKNPILSRTQC